MNSLEVTFEISQRNIVILLPPSHEVLAIITDQDNEFKQKPNKIIKKSFRQPSLVDQHQPCKKSKAIIPKIIERSEANTKQNDIELDELTSKIQNCTSEFVMAFNKLFSLLRERTGQNSTKKDILLQLGFDLSVLHFDEDDDDFTNF